ncbi:MAG: hypothetical protein ACE5F1_15570, partial [Planctomycetota bacterium]
RSQLLGKKWMTTVLVRISSLSAWSELAELGANLNWYSTFWSAYFGSLASWHASRAAHRAERLDRAIDCLRARHGFGAIVAGESVELLGKLAHSRDGFRLRTPSLTL